MGRMAGLGRPFPALAMGTFPLETPFACSASFARSFLLELPVGPADFAVDAPAVCVVVDDFRLPSEVLGLPCISPVGRVAICPKFINDAGVTGAREGLPFVLAIGVPSALNPPKSMTTSSLLPPALAPARAKGTAGGGIASVVEISTGDGVEFGTSPTGSIVPLGRGLGSGDARG